MGKMTDMARPQFSLRFIFFACAAVGLGLGTWRARITPLVAVAIFFASIALPALMATAAQCAAGRPRAFWIGAMFPAIGAAIVTMSHLGMVVIHSDGVSFSLFCEQVQFGVASIDLQVKALWLSMPVVGSLCAAMHWLLSTKPPA